MSVRRELFIYYRVRSGASARAAELVSEFQHHLMQRRPGLVARCLRKDEAFTDTPTWMETYAMNGDAHRGIDTDLEAEIEQLARSLQDCIDGTRHVEAFL